MDKVKQLESRRILSASPWIFAAACGLLALIISVFAISNFQREKKLMTIALNQEGRAILSLVSSSSRDALRRTFMRGEINGENWRESVQQVVENGSEHPRIVALYLLNDRGEVLAHGNPERVGDTADSVTRSFLGGFANGGDQDSGHIVEQDQGKHRVFQIVKPFYPLAIRDGIPPHMREMIRGRMGRGMAERLSPQERDKIVEDINRQKMFLVAELNLDEFSDVVRQQFVQIILLSLILLLVGVGGILSLMLLQGLRLSQSRLKTMSAFTDVLVSSLPVGLIAMDPEGKVRTCNQTAGILLNLDDKMAEGQVFENIVPEIIRRELNGKSGKMKYQPFEVRLPQDFENHRSLHITFIDIKGSGQHSGTMLLIQDLSQLKKLEAELQRAERDAAVGRMAAGVAHELRNPLSSIKGLALLLASRFDQKGKDQEAAELLVDEVERLNRSISELLDYARPGQVHVKISPVDSLVHKAVTLIRADAEAAGIRISESYHCPDAYVSADPDKMTQVVLNLCLNSLQAMVDGGWLSVQTREETDQVSIEITDSGTGINAKILPRVFDPYFTTKHEGTGLGLAMSAKIVDDHHGSMQLTSEPGVETKAVIKLPLAREGN